MNCETTSQQLKMIFSLGLSTHTTPGSHLKLRVQTGRWENRALLRTLDGRQAVRWPRYRDQRTHWDSSADSRVARNPADKCVDSLLSGEPVNVKLWWLFSSTLSLQKTRPNSLLVSYISFQHPPTTFSGGVTKSSTLFPAFLSPSHTCYKKKQADSWSSSNLFYCCVKQTCGAIPKMLRKHATRTVHKCCVDIKYHA